VNGGYFLRAGGKKVQVSGSFRNFGNTVVNHGKSFSLNSDPNTLTGQSYEFMTQELSLDINYTATKIIGRSLIFIIQPDGNNSMTLTTDSYFSFKKNILL